MPTPENTTRPEELLHRDYTTTLDLAGLHQAIDQLLLTNPRLADCFVDDEAAPRFRIDGLGLRAPILVETLAARGRTTFSLHFRQADHLAVREIVRGLGAKSRRGGCRLLLVDMLQDFALPGVAIADSAIDSALDCSFDETARMFDVLGKLAHLTRAIRSDDLAELNEEGHFEYLVPRNDAETRTILFRGQPLRLDRRVSALGRHTGLRLRVHFAWVPSIRQHVVGWLDESEGEV